MCSLTWVLVIIVAVAQIVLYYSLRSSLSASLSQDYEVEDEESFLHLCPDECICETLSIICSQTELRDLPAGNWTTVQQLILDQNEITEIPRDISHRFPKLTDISLTSNKLIILDLAAFVGFNATSQDLVAALGWNAISTIIPPPIGSAVESLGYLDLSGNELEYLNSDVFRDVPNLKMICLTSNPLQLPANSPFLSSSSVKLLYLAHIDASLLSEKTFSELPSLTELSLSNSKIRNIKNAFSSLHSLSYLYLKNNNITEVKISSFSPGAGFFMMDFDGNPLQDLDPADLPVQSDGTLSFVNTPLACALNHKKITSWAAKKSIVLRDACNGAPIRAK